MEDRSRGLANISARVDPETKELLIDYADRLGITVSEAVNDIIGRYIRRQWQEPTTKAPPFTDEQLEQGEAPEIHLKHSDPAELKEQGKRAQESSENLTVEEIDALIYSMKVTKEDLSKEDKEDFEASIKNLRRLRKDMVKNEEGYKAAMTKEEQEKLTQRQNKG